MGERYAHKVEEQTLAEGQRCESAGEPDGDGEPAGSGAASSSGAPPRLMSWRKRASKIPYDLAELVLKKALEENPTRSPGLAFFKNLKRDLVAQGRMAEALAEPSGLQQHVKNYWLYQKDARTVWSSGDLGGSWGLRGSSGASVWSSGDLGDYWGLRGSSGASVWSSGDLGGSWKLRGSSGASVWSNGDLGGSIAAAANCF